MIAGYAVFWIVTFGFLLSLWVRTRNLLRDAALLRDLVESERRRRSRSVRRRAGVRTRRRAVL
jgi:hypothetical protein